MKVVNAQDPEELLAHVAWARRLADSLVRDPHLAEDLVQDAMESGLRRSGSVRAGLQAWLAGTIRNLRKEALRTDARRLRREQASDRAPSPSTPDVLLEKIEAQRRIAEAVARLPEPERSALVLRYHEEQSFRGIAAALGISEKAAESRVYRGLQRLREEFRTREGADWAAAFLPLLQPAGAAAAAASGVLIMTANTKWLLGAVGALALLASGLLFFDHATEPESDAANVAPGAWSGDAAPPEAAADAIGGADTAAEAAAGALVREDTKTGLWLRVLSATGEPVAGAEVLGLELQPNWPMTVSSYSTSPEYHFGHRIPPIRGVAGADGRVMLRQETGRFRGMLYVRGAGTLQQVFAVEESNAVHRDLGDYRLERGGFFQIRFVDEDGNPAQGAQIWFSSKIMKQPPGHVDSQKVRTDANGLARFDSVPLGSGRVVCRGPGYLPWQMDAVEATTEPAPPQTVTLSRGASAAILVVDARGNPVAGAEIYEDFIYETTATVVHPGWPFFLGITAADGTFLVRGLGDGGKRIVAKSGDSWSQASVRPGPEIVRIELRPVHVLSGRVRHLGGPIEEGGQLLIADPVRSMQIPYLRLDLTAGGAFTVPLPAGSYGLAIRHPEGSWMREQEFALTGDLDLGEIEVPAAPELRLICVDAADGRPVPQGFAQPAHPTAAEWSGDEQWRFQLQRWLAAMPLSQKSGNVLTLRHLSRGPHRLEVSAPGYRSQKIEVELGREGAERTVALEAETRLTLAVLDADGLPAAGETFELVPESYDEHWREADEPVEPLVRPVQALTDAAGIADVGFLFPGRWRVKYLWRPDGLVLGELELQAGTNSHSLKLPRNSALSFAVTHRGLGVPDAKIEIRRKREGKGPQYSDGYENGGFSVTTDESGRARFECREPGDHRFTVGARGFFPVVLDLAVTGSDLQIPIALDGAVVSGILQGGAPRTEVAIIHFRSAEGTEESRLDVVESNARHSLLHAGGVNPWWSIAVTLVDPGQEFQFRGLPPGRHYLVARADGWASSAPQVLEVGEKDLTGLSLSLTRAASCLVRVTGVPEFRARHPGMELRLEVHVDGRTITGRPFRMVEDGDCRFETLPAGSGELVVSLNPSDHSFRTELRRIPVALSAGLQAELGLDASSLAPDKSE